MSDDNTQFPAITWVGKRAVKVIGIPVATQYRMIEDGRLPEPIKPKGIRGQYWMTDTLLQFLRDAEGAS